MTNPVFCEYFPCSQAIFETVTKSSHIFKIFLHTDRIFQSLYYTHTVLLELLYNHSLLYFQGRWNRGRDTV